MPQFFSSAQRGQRHGTIRPRLLLAHTLLAGVVLQAGVAVAVSGRPAARRAPSPSHAAPERRVPTPAPSTRKRATPPPVQKPASRKRPATKRASAPKSRRLRWIPTGIGMWTNKWPETERGSVAGVIRRAKRVGLSYIFVKTGTRKGGFVGGPLLRRLLPATRGTSIRVIAWDFPTLVNPVEDARRLVRAARFTAPGKGTPHVAAVAPDIETGSEGTTLTGARVALYYGTLRRLLPHHVAILATVPWPSEHRIGHYPYALTARYADAFVPMAYWVNRDPATVARQSVRYLARYHRPVLPAGQAYDPRMDNPGLRLGPPTAAQILAFARSARRSGARSASLWVWQTANGEQWQAWARARRLFVAPKKAQAKKKTAPARPTSPQPARSV